MVSFADKVAALKGNNTAKNTRSPLNDPFFAESLIIQSKSIVGRMYSRNEYVRFKYECELSQLVKQYRVWLAEIKREEREVAAKLDAMRKDQREMTKERRDPEAIQLVARTNREFIDHYKRRRYKTSANKHSFNNPLKLANDFGKGGKASLETVRLPNIVKKVDEVVELTKSTSRTTSLPFIAAQKEKRNTSVTPAKSKLSDKSSKTKKPERVNLMEGLLRNTDASDSPLRSKTPSLRSKTPRVLSAPKSRREGRTVTFTTARPSSACQTT